VSAQVAADLRAAAEVIRRRGLAKHSYIGNRGERCAVGALMALVNPTSQRLSVLSHDEHVRVWRGESALADHLGEGVMGWNDAPGRTADEVIAALLAAADAAEATP
jgi:hypothetical protein